MFRWWVFFHNKQQKELPVTFLNTSLSSVTCNQHPCFCNTKTCLRAAAPLSAVRSSAHSHSRTQWKLPSTSRPRDRGSKVTAPMTADYQHHWNVLKVRRQILSITSSCNTSSNSVKILQSFICPLLGERFKNAFSSGIKMNLAATWLQFWLCSLKVVLSLS